ncbi:MAG: ABC transporter permease, partial [Planctomycetota bacterium]
MEKLKYGLLKAINISGLTFLDPVVRLASGEEPRVQLGKIGRFIVVPALGIFVAVMLWAYLAPKHKTKSGEVPTPWVTLEAAGDVWRFHVTEGDKDDAFLLVGADRDEAITATEARLEELAVLTEKADAEVAAARSAADERVAAIVGPVQADRDKLKAELETAKKDGQDALKEKGAAIAVDDTAARSAYLKELADFQAQLEADDEALDLLEERLDEAKATATPGVKSALRAQTLIAEEKQYLEKKLALLNKDGRAARLGSTEEQIAKARAEFEAAEGPAVYASARKLLRAEEREA